MIPDVARWTPLVCAPVIIFVAIYFLYKSQTVATYTINGSILALGVGLIIFDAMMAQGKSISSFSFDIRHGFTVKTGVSEDKENQTADVAAIQPFVDKTNKAIELINTALSEQDKKINAIVGSAKNTNSQIADIKQIKTPTIPQIKIPVDESGKTVLVFYKSNEKMANEIVTALRSRGFKSAASNSSLSEIQKWVDNTGKNDVTVASNGIDDELLSNIKNIISSTEPNLSGKLETESGWAFKAADAQVYIF